MLVSVFVVGENSGIGVTKGDNTSAGQRGGVNEMSAAEGASVKQAVGQYKTAFSISIDDLNGFAGHGNLYIARLLGLAAGHIFRCADNANHFDFGFKQCD